MGKTSKYVAKSFLWGATSMLLDASVKFISVPLLLKYFGKDNYGLIALAFSVNAYLQLLDMGINTGAVKYFSEWIQSKKMDVLDSVARTSITFYGIVGFINALILISLAIWGMSVFSISPDQAMVLRRLLIILSLFAVINWSTSVFNQLLTANESIYYVQQVNMLRSIMSLILIFVTIHSKLTITNYFTFFILLNSIVLVPFYLKAKKDKLIRSFMPAFDWKNFSIIFKYSLAIISIGIFQVSAAKSRPIILSIYSSKGIGIISDYRVMETITLFIISIGGMFSTIFLPKTSKLIVDNDLGKLNQFADEATLYTSAICVYLCIPFALCSSEILTIYVGKDYNYLSIWLNIWVFTILAFLHSTPVHSIILSIGKTRPIVICTAISCIISIVINILLCNKFGVGSAVIGYSIYILIQMSFYYFYFHEVIGLDTKRIFKAFFKPTVFGIIFYIVVWKLNIHVNQLLVQVILKCGIWALLYSAALYFLKIIDINLIKGLVLKGKK